MNLKYSTVAVISLIFFGYFPAIPSEVILQSPIVTNWGEWGLLEYCPENTFVVAMELQSDRYSSSSSSDQVGLSGIRLYCSKPSTYNGTDTISSSSINVGYYGSKFYCGNAAVGFQLRSEQNQGNGDDSGANNLRLYCSSSSDVDLEQGPRYLEGDGTLKGEWTTAQICFKRQAICGLQTMVESALGSAGDDTGLNNIRVKCCDIPDPATLCTPSDDWDLLVECDNLIGITPMTCSYEKRVGLSHTEIQSEGQSLERSFYESLDFSAGFASNGLSLNFKNNLGHSDKTGYNWQQTSTNEWHEETKTSISFEVSPGLKAELYQTLGKCGMYNVRPVRFRRIDTRNETNPVFDKPQAVNKIYD